MFDARIPYSGSSVSMLERKLSTIKDLHGKLNLMSKPKNFTYMDCAEIIELMDTLKRSVEATLEEAKKREKE